MDAVTRIKEVATYDRPHVRRGARGCIREPCPRSCTRRSRHFPNASFRRSKHASRRWTSWYRIRAHAPSPASAHPASPFPFTKSEQKSGFRAQAGCRGSLDGKARREGRSLWPQTRLFRLASKCVTSGPRTWTDGTCLLSILSLRVRNTWSGNPKSSLISTASEHFRKRRQLRTNIANWASGSIRKDCKSTEAPLP